MSLASTTLPISKSYLIPSIHFLKFFIIKFNYFFIFHFSLFNRILSLIYCLINAWCYYIKYIRATLRQYYLLKIIYTLKTYIFLFTLGGFYGFWIFTVSAEFKNNAEWGFRFSYIIYHNHSCRFYPADDSGLCLLEYIKKMGDDRHAINRFWWCN